MVAEIFIMEISGISVNRVFDPKRGFAPVTFSDEE